MMLSIVIVTWNCATFIGDCLDSIEGNGLREAFEVIVVDNHSSDATCEVIRQAHPTVTLISLPDNLGFGHANNVGIARARGEHVLVLNPDTILTPGTLERCLTHLNEHPDVAAVGGELLNEDGSLQAAYFPFPSPLYILVFALGFGTPYFEWWKRRVYKPLSVARDVDWISGTFMVVRRTAIDQVGGFDERFFFYVEETEWCYRMKKAGWRIHFLSDVQVFHLRGKSSEAYSTKRIHRTTVELALNGIRGNIMFFDLHQSPPMRLAVRGVYLCYGVANYAIGTLLFIVRGGQGQWRREMGRGAMHEALAKPARNDQPDPPSRSTE